MTYNACPACGHKPKDLFAAFMPVHRCNDCGHEYCHQCSGSNGGRRCPKCGCTSSRTVGKVYK